MSNQATILLVEDDQALLEGIADLLEVSDLGYELHLLKAANGEIGLQILASQVPDLIISDIMMPRLDGYEFLRRIRQSPELVHIPVIFLTAKGTKHDVLRGRMSGAELYIKKPYDSDELCRLVKGQLDRAFELRSGRQRQAALLSRNIVQLLHHEFRTPLTYVTAYHSLLADGLGQEDPGELLEYLDGIRAGARRMSALVGNLLQVLAIWTGEAAERHRLEARQINGLSEMLYELCEPYQAEIVARNGRLVCDVEQELPAIYGVDDYVCEMVRQLLANAVAFACRAPDRVPEVSVRAEAAGDYVRITVEDNGVGLPEAAYERIFELFYQHDRPNFEQQGAGAGLPITQGLAEIHGGWIEVSSEPMAGAAFSLFLPLWPQIDLPETRVPGSVSSIPATVLLVEDEEFLLAGLKDLLETLESRYRLSIMSATNGRSALALLAQRTPDLIVTDIMMPEMNGYQLMAEVRANPEWVDIPVIFLTARGERRDVLLGLSSGAEEYITKPYDVDELFGVLLTQLDRRFLRRRVAKYDLEKMKVSVLELLLAEFAAPLQDVSQYSELLREGLRAVHSVDQLRAYLSQLEQGSDHVSRLVEDFVLLAELRTGEAVDWFKLQATPLHMGEALQEIIPVLQQGNDWLDVEIRYNLESKADEAIIDRRLLATCIERLAEEIVAYCPPEQAVRLNLSLDGEDGRVQLSAGSAEARLDDKILGYLGDILASKDVFDPQLREFSLSLLLVKGIIHYHQGAISVRRGPGTGVTFVLSLPADSH